jgi:hypothetical protein
MCILHHPNKPVREPTKEDIEATLFNEIDLIEQISKRALAAYDNRDAEEAMTVCALIAREGGIGWRAKKTFELFKEKI